MSFGGFGGFGATNNQQQQSTGFGGFGASTNNTPASGFGSTNSGFGATNNNAAGSSLFGGGNSTASGGFGASAFGATANNSSPFGAAKPAFGAPAATTGGTMFGATNNTATSGTGFGGFGAPAATSTPAFGASTNTGGSLFGAAAKPAFGGTTGGGMFGGAANTGAVTSTGFGSPAASTTGFGGSGFGASTTAQTAQNNGTATTPFAAHIEKDPGSSSNSHYQSITFQQPYQGFSFEELRLADYNAGRRYGNSNGQAGAFGTSTGFGGFGAQNTNTATTGFGASGGNTGGGLFGANNNNTTANASPFGQAQPAATGFGGSTGGLFGANKPATGGLFGSTAAAPAATGGGLFGAAPANNAAPSTGFGGFGTANNNTTTGTGLFGANANKPATPAFGTGSGTGFGSTGTTGFGAPAATTGGFGQNAGTTGGLFGAANNNQQQPATGGGLFGQQNNQQPQQQNTGGGLFGGSGFGQNNQTQQPAQAGATGGLFGGGGFGQNNQNQQKPGGLFGNNTATSNTGGGLFGAQPQQNQQQGGTGLFGAQNNQQQNAGGGLFGQKPATGGGLFGANNNAGATQAGGSLFGGGLGQQNQQQNTGGGLFGNNNQQQQQKPGGLFGSLGGNNNNTGGGLFGGSQNNNAGGSLFGGANNQQQGGSSFGQSQQNQQQGQQSLAATLLSNPYGNDQLFQNLGTPSTPVGPLATPLSGAQKSAKKPTPLPQFKINPTASLRLITPQKRSNGYGFSYQTYGTPGSAQSFTSNGLGSSLLQSGGLTRSLGKSFSTTNLRGSLGNEAETSSVLAPGAFTPNSRPYAGGSIRRLKIDRNIRTDLFGDGVSSEPSTLNKKRVSFSNDTGRLSASSGLQTSASSSALVRTSEPEESSEPSPPPAASRPTTNGTKMNGTPLRHEMSQTSGKELDIVPEDGPAPTAARNVAKDLPKSHSDQTPGEYWMSPSIEELRNMSREQLKKVHGFTVGRNGVGKIEFDDVDLTSVPLDEVCGGIVKLNIRSATVYETGVNTPPMGKGLNVPSTITLENSWPRSHAGRLPVHERKGPRFDKHLERLKRVVNTEFISYDSETGVWIFRVQHFTTYGLDDDDDEDYTEYTTDAMDTQEPSPMPQAIPQEDAASEESFDESNPDDTFDFKKGPSKTLPGGFDGGQSIYADEDMADETDAQNDDNSSFLEQRGMSMLEDPFGSSGTGNAAALAVQAEDRPIDEEVMETAGAFPEPVQQPIFGASLKPKSILKNSTMLMGGTPKKEFALTGDWAEQLQRTVSPKKQDRHALRERQATAIGAASTTKPLFGASVAGKAFNTTMDIMNSLWEPAAPTHSLKTSSAGKGFEWPYPKRARIGDAFSELNELDGAFHASVKPSWAPDNTLVYAIPGSAPPVDGNMSAAMRSIVSEGKDVRFANLVAPNANTSSLQLQMARTAVAVIDGTPVAHIPESVTFAAFAEDIAEQHDHSKSEYAIWKVASIVFDPVKVSCAYLTRGLSDEEVAALEHRIRRDALSDYWAELVREEAQRAAKDAATAEEKAFAFLTSKDIEGACAALVDGNDLRLATIIAQLPGNSTMKDLMKKQMDAWRKQNILSEMSEPIRALYELASGNVCVSEGKTGAPEDRAPTFRISKRFGLDWRRAFGLRLWFGDHPTDTIADAVKAYAEDVASGRENVNEQELVSVDDASKAGAKEDTVFGLLRLFSTKESSSLTDLLAPASVSGNPLDARLAWQLATLLRQKKIVSSADLSDDTLDSLCLSLAAQLEMNNELSGALKTLMHLSSPSARETNIRSMLYRRAAALSAASGRDSLPAGLTDELQIPAQWLWQARALYARAAEKDHVTEAACLLRAGAYDEAHAVLCRTVGPQAVISQGIDNLRELLGGFVGLGEEARIEGWETGGQVYFDYVYLVDMDGRPADEKKLVLERLVAAVPSMLAVRHKERVELEERVAVSLISSAVKAACEKLGRDERVVSINKLERLPTAGDAHAKRGVETCSSFYKAIVA